MKILSHKRKRGGPAQPWTAVDGRRWARPGPGAAHACPCAAGAALVVKIGTEAVSVLEAPPPGRRGNAGNSIPAARHLLAPDGACAAAGLWPGMESQGGTVGGHPGLWQHSHSGGNRTSCKNRRRSGASSGRHASRQARERWEHYPCSSPPPCTRWCWRCCRAMARDRK